MVTEDDAALRAESTRPKRKSGRNSRVHFDEAEIVKQEEQGQPILVEDIYEDSERKTIGVYLGFLQEAHKYEVRFKIPLESLTGFVHSRAESIVLSAPPSHGQMKTMNWLPDPSNLEIFLELGITEPITFDDKFTICSDAQPSRFVQVKLWAQVLGKGMGTPLLKEGIKCAGILSDQAMLVTPLQHISCSEQE